MMSVEEKKKTFWNVKEFAAFLGVSKALIYDRVYRKEIPCKRIGKRILIPASFVMKMVEE